MDTFSKSLSTGNISYWIYDIAEEIFQDRFQIIKDVGYSVFIKQKVVGKKWLAPN